MLPARSVPAAIQVLRQFAPALTVALQHPGLRWLGAEAGEVKRRGRRKAPPPEQQREQPKQQHEDEKAASAAAASGQTKQQRHRNQQQAFQTQHEAAQDQEQKPGQQQGSLGGHGVPNGSIDPRLQAHIQQLRMLKGATRLSQQTLGHERQPGLMTWLADLGSGYLQRWIEGFIQARLRGLALCGRWLAGAAGPHWHVCLRRRRPAAWPRWHPLWPLFVSPPSAGPSGEELLCL